MDPSIQWAQPLAPAEPTEMDVENTPALASIKKVPSQEFQPADHMEQSPAAPQHSSMGYESFQGCEVEASGARDAMQAVEPHYEEEVHHPERVLAEAAAASVDVPSPLVARGGANQGSEQGQGTPAAALAPQLIPGQAGHQQDSPAQMEVDKVAPASSAPFSLGVVGGQDLAERLAEDAHNENAAAAGAAAAAAAATGTLPAGDRPVQAPLSEPNEVPATDRPIRAHSSEPDMAPAADQPMHTLSPEPYEATAKRPDQAPPFEPYEAIATRPTQAPTFEAVRVTAASDSLRLGSPGTFEERQREDPEEACEQAAGTPLAYVRTDSAGVEGRGDGSGQEAAHEGKESIIDLQGETPALPAPGSAGPAATGTPRGGVGVAYGGRRHAEIKPETDAGAVVWAKTPRYPWWPAQVLSREDPWIPADMEAPRRGAVPVRFFGTYNFAWIESQRALGPWGDGVKDERTTKGKIKVFQDALSEAEHFLATGETPRGFEMGLVPEGGDAAEDGTGAGGSGGHPRARPRDGKGVSKKDGKSAVLKRREADKAAAAARASAHRKLKAMRKLGLAPPRGSPYGGEPCLDVARNWMGLLQRQLAEQAQRAEARAAAAAAQMRAHEQQRKLHEQHVHQLYMEAQRRQHQLLQQQAQQKQQELGAQVPSASLAPAHVPSQMAAGVRPSQAVQQQAMSSPAQAAFVTRPVFTPPPAASVVQSGVPSQAAIKQMLLDMRPCLARPVQAPIPQPQHPLQPAGPGGSVPSPHRAQSNAAAHSNLAHTLQQLRAMQQQHVRSSQSPNTAPVFRQNAPAVGAVGPSGGHPAQQPGHRSPSEGHHAQQPGHLSPSGGHHSQQPGDQQPPRAVGDASEGGNGQRRAPPQLINS